MAPNFFQKLVKVANTNREPARERVSSSSDTVVDTHASAFQQQRNRSQSASAVSSPTTPTQSSISRHSTAQLPADSRVPSIITTLSNGTKSLGKKKSKSRIRSRSHSSERVRERKSFDSIATFSTQPNVTIVPPSPLAYNADLSDWENEDEKSSANGTAESANTGTTTPAATPPTSAKEPATPEVQSPTTPTPATFANKSTPTPPTNTNTTTATMSNSLAPGMYQVRKQSSNRSINSKKGAPADINVNAGTSPNSPSNHPRAATAPAEVSEGGVVMTHRPVVESPTELKFPTSTPNGSAANGTPPPPVPPIPNGGAMPPVARENTSATLSAPDSKGSKRPWKRSTTRKPTGLASAIAASGLAMANPSLSAAQHAQIGGPPPVISPGSSKSSDKDKDKDKQPYLSRSPAQSSVSQRSHGKARSADMNSPRSVKSRKSSNGSAHGGGRRSRRPSAAQSDGAGSENHGHTSGGGDGESVVRADYYSGLDLLDDDESSDEEESGSGSDIDGLLLGEDDIPVTGFAVASNKRNADFHELFPTVPEGDYLIEGECWKSTSCIT